MYPVFLRKRTGMQVNRQTTTLRLPLKAPNLGIPSSRAEAGGGPPDFQRGSRAKTLGSGSLDSNPAS